MTYEEVITLIKINVCYKQNICEDGICKSTEERPCAIDVAIECIKKQMPKPKKKTDLNGKCGSCKYATPNETHFGCSPCYIICKKPGKVFRTSIAHVKQRTNKACKGYEMKAVNK